MSGNAQTAIAGLELGAPLAARVLDTSGSPLSGHPVTFVVASGGGSLFLGATTSDSQGEIRDRWMLGTQMGSQAVEVRGTNASGAPAVLARFTAEAVAGAAANASINYTTLSAQQLTTLPPISVLVQDIFGNPRAGVAVTFVPCATCGSVDPVSAVTNANGAVHAVWTLGAAVGAQTLVATPAGLPALTFTANSSRAPPTAPTLVSALSGGGQSVDQHRVLAQPVRAFVTDVLGNGVPGVSVSFAGAVGGGYVEAATVTTNEEGIAGYTPYVHTAGSQQIVAFVTGLSPATFNVTVTANAFRYDGYYLCSSALTGATPRPSQFQLFVNSNIVTGTELPITGRNLVAIAFNPANGAFTASRNYALDYQYRLTGSLTVDAQDVGTAGGTMVDYDQSNPSGLTGNWSCTRR